MSGMQNQRLVDKPPAPPLDFPRGKLVYTNQIRRRNRRYRLFAVALSILAVATGLVALLLANWLSTVMSR